MISIGFPLNCVAALMKEAEQNGGKLEWVKCDLCVDERGAGEAVEGAKRGTPADFWQFAENSTNTLSRLTDKRRQTGKRPGQAHHHQDT
jgi:hypothetical protein